MKKVVLVILFNLFISAVYAADGDLDTAFNASAVQFGSQATLYKVRLAANGKMYISGAMTQLNGAAYSKPIARLNADGTTDTAFAAAIDAFGTAYDFAVYPDNKVVLAATVGGAPKIVRLNADGSLDSSFAGQTFDTLPEYIRSVAIQADGKVLVGGYFTTIGGAPHASLVRLNADGTVDTGFNPNLTGDSIFYVATIVVQPDNKILIGGSFKGVVGALRFDIARLNPDGTSDTVFNQGVGAQRPDQLNFSYGANDIKLLPDGRIYFVDAALYYNGTPTGEVVRLNSNGTRDTTFNLSPNKVGVNGLAVQSDGKVIVVGRGKNYTSGFPVIRNGAVKINPDGSIDTSFSPVGIPNGEQVFSIAIQTDGKIVLVGNFAMFNNVAKNAIVRLLNTISAAPVFQSNRVSDFDGDGRADASVFRNGEWFINPSNAPSVAPNAFYSVQFGLATDKLAPADYDGDGKTDVAVWRENVSGNQAYFYILQSATGAVRVEQFGLTGDVLAAGDWDGDGKADLATWRGGAQSYFFYRGSLNNPSSNVTYVPWGTTGDKPVRGDFDGDSKLDAAVYRPANQIWYIRQSADNQTISRQFGLSADKLVPADFDGDGKSDIAVFRGGVWYVWQSSNNQIRYQNWGAATDTLVPSDYDGDGKTDFAVWRSGTYYILNSANAAISYQNFGGSGDVPAASAFVR
ncbi:MAG TPA: FG-GAP-like repeat-containing protein [Pyrinomonadaceae bacterium]|jgi:uncharacterized delta-60 repeat protein